MKRMYDRIDDLESYIKKGRRNSSQRRNNCADHITISRPLENVGTWRGFFEPSTTTFGMERERVCVGYVIRTILTTKKEFCNISFMQ